MYLGEATFYQERMKEFLYVAQELNIEGISQNVWDRDVVTTKETFPKEEYLLQNDEINVIQGKNRISAKRNEEGKFECERCDQSFGSKKGLFNHIIHHFTYPLSKIIHFYSFKWA